MLLPPNAMNAFTASGMLLVLMGGLMAYMRTVPEAIWRWIVRQTTVTINVKDDDPAFEWVKEWMMRQNFIHKVRRVDLDSNIRGKLLSLMPAPGNHVFWRNGRPFWLDFLRSDEAKGQWEAKRAETLHFMMLGRDRKLLEQFVSEVLSSRLESERMESELYVWEEWWRKQKAYAPRTLDAVLLKNGEKEALLADVQAFLMSKERYAALGIPYHRGYLFYGPPGTGKTSLVSAFANALGMSIYLINLSDMSDKTLKLAMGRIPENSVILFEDIDASGAAKKRVDKKPKSVNTKDTPNEEGSLKEIFGVSLSGLLNVLDGFYAPDSVLFVMTTNHIDNLDPALLRPGRIDYRLYMGEATHSQKVSLYKRFFPNDSLATAEEFVKSRPEHETMAEFQGLLLNHKKGTP